MTASIKEIAGLVGKRYHYVTSGMKVEVGAVDAKLSYGNVLLLVEPMNGSGQVWVRHTSLAPIVAWPMAEGRAVNR